MEGEKRSLNSELWHACAGPLVSLPTIGSQVVYFPQGHSEQVTALTKKEADAHIPNYSNLPSQLICQLHNVTLHAEAETDEVYCQMILQPVNAQEKSSYLLPDLGRQNKQCNEYFCKTLTASDTSTHGGFSIPRRAAEKVFPPLDFSQQPPAQELVARDLHDNEWHFRHIYRGQPRRHLLTTGWSVFVSAKRLQAGDSVLFIRDENGQLLLGIRRANRIQPSMPSSLLSSDSMHIGILAAAAHAYNTSSRFAIFYNPRASPSEFVVPISKYNKAVYTMQFSIGMRFRMQFETEDSSSRRYTGTITGIGDLDPVRWPNSYWRSLKVGWDESASGERQKRVSLWEIEPFTTPFLFCSPALTLRTKRPRTPGAEQAMINGDMEDLTSSVRKSSIWLGGQNMGRIQSLGISSMNPDEWAQMRRPDSVRAAAKPDHHFAMMSAGLQGNCNSEASQQVLFHQNQQRLLSQNVQAGTKLLQQTLPPVIVGQPQHNQQQLHIQEQRKCNSQQHTQPLHHQSLQLEQRIIDARRSFLQCSSNNAQSILEKPVDLVSPLRAINSFEAVSPSSTLVKPQGLLSRQHANTLPFIDTTRSLGVPHSNPGLIKDGSGLVPGLAPDHLQSAGWFSMETEPIRMHDHLNSNATTAQIEMSANGLPFCVSDSEHVVQTGLFGIISHPSPFNPQEPTHGREHFQSDPRSHLLFGVSIDSPLVGSNTDCVSSATFPENKNDHRQLGGNEPPCVTVTCSGSEALFNSNSQVSSVLDETVTLESDSNWKQLQPTRTFTKVYKTGSVGRSLDVTCLKNYNELRAEIAHMFGLEGQIEDPRISCWQLVFIDNENDVLLVGDDPWDEFVNCVRCIKVMSPSEVLQMSQDGIELFHSIPAPRPISSNSANNIAQRDMNNTNPTGAPLRSDH